MAKKHKSDPKDWLIKRYRDGDKHIKACKQGYYKPGKTFRQVHHILPVSSVADGTISQYVKTKPKLTKIHNCLKETPWDVNEADNCVGLPLKRAFHDKRAPKNWAGWPCHQVDHNPDYTDEVSKDLNENIWKPCLSQTAECEFDGGTVASLLISLSNIWLAELQTRGAREGGMQHCWDNRKKLDKWYVPFSMAANPRRRSAPADFEALEKNVQQYLQKIFTAI
jgi:hypothetical protein